MEDMWLPLIFIAYLVVASGSGNDGKTVADPTFVPRYTLTAESKNKDLDLSPDGDRQRPPINEKGHPTQKPWRRGEYVYDGVYTANWPAPSAPNAMLGLLGPLLAPGLLLMGVNLGALLYMLLGLLGLAPPRSNRHATSDDIYRRDRHNLGDGKESAIYF
ncbi:uncharacterized protein LOC117895527 [Drosophila subobscura]|uniref:uncharacterized protein LOC117895527 n=1 Tax=Drosophila subobscura TaxID=7241 RepID=UPI00155A4906|nr:uncharacterized protein LOC117895527 [Drosophila subobscura]